MAYINYNNYINYINYSLFTRSYALQLLKDGYA